MRIHFRQATFALLVSACEETDDSYRVQRALDTDYSTATAPEPASQAPRDTLEMPAPRALSGGSPRARGAADRGYYTGPRGGCYTYSASGRKRYVDRSYCN